MSPAEVTGLTSPSNQHRLCHLWVMCEQITRLAQCNKPLLSRAGTSHRALTGTTVALEAWGRGDTSRFWHCAQRLSLQEGGGAA